MTGALVRKLIEAKEEIKETVPTEASQPSYSEKTDHKKEVYLPTPYFSQNLTDQIEEIRQAIQRLCLNIVPLGKSMDLIQEDVDAMNRELEIWRAKRSKFEDQIQEELK